MVLRRFAQLQQLKLFSPVAEAHAERCKRIQHWQTRRIQEGAEHLSASTDKTSMTQTCDNPDHGGLYPQQAGHLEISMMSLQYAMSLFNVLQTGAAFAHQPGVPSGMFRTLVL